MVQDKMNWYINRKTNELVQGKLIDEHILSIRIDDYWELKDASQYGEAVISPDSPNDEPHIRNNQCDIVPPCIPYIPKQKQADEEPVFPICGTCNARKDAYLLLPPEKIRDILQTGGTPEDFSIEIAKAELDHLAKLGIVYVEANDSSPVIEGNKDIIPVAEGYGFQISTVEEEAELGKKLISQEEYEECGDDEDMLIAQHNKTVKNMLAAGYKKFIPLSDYIKGEGK